MTSNRIVKDTRNSVSLVSANTQGADRTAAKRICVLVLGTHRSGTSAITRVLSIAGARLPATLMGAATGNDLGHWESDALVQLHDRVLDDLDSAWHDWRALDLNRIPAKQRGDIKDEITGILQAEYAEAPLFVVKDPRICRFAPLFLDGLDSISVAPRVILTIRNPLEVCESLERRDQMPRSEAALLWLRHVLDAEAATRTCPRAIVSYNQFLADWRGTFEALTAKTGIDWPYGIEDVAPQIDQFLSPKHRHHTRSTEQVILDPLLRDWIAETYEALLVLERNPGSDTALNDLDRIRAVFNQAAPILHRLREDVRAASTAETRDLRAALSESQEERDGEVSALNTALAEAENKAQRLVASLSEKNTETDELRAALSGSQEEREELRSHLSERDGEISALKNTHVEAKRKAEQLAAGLAEKDAETDELRAVLSDTQEEGERLRASLTARAEESAGSKAELAEAEERWRALEEAFAQEKETLSEALQEKETARVKVERIRDEIAENLREASDAIQGMQASLSWRTTSPLRSFGRQQLRLGAFAATLVAGVKLGGGVVTTIAKACRILKEEGVQGLQHRYRYISDRRAYHDGSAEAAGFLPQPCATAGQQTDIPMGEIKRNILENLKSIEARVAEWSRPPPKAPLTAKKLRQRLGDIAPEGFNRLILSVTHDDYTAVVGGVQFCVHIEEREFANDGGLYLNIHPHNPLPVLSREKHADRFFFQVIANGTLVGVASARMLIVALNDFRPLGGRTECVIHSLIGHSPEILGEVLEAARTNHALFWLHDYFSVCPSHNLLRNDITFCNAPDSLSPACTTCVFGEERQEHLSRIRAFFDKFDLDIISPAKYPLDLWQHSSTLRYRKAIVVPHCSLKTKPNAFHETGRNADRSIQIAFLGHPVIHKGWPVFAQLASQLTGNDRLQFHHLGQTNSKHPNIHFTNVRTSVSHCDAMVQAIIANDIDVVLLWSICPETFSFTLHEASAAGALVITNPLSGNIQTVAKERDDGIVLEDEARLIQFFREGELEQFVRQHRLRGRPVSKMEYSSLSRTLLSKF